MKVNKDKAVPVKKLWKAMRLCDVEDSNFLDNPLIGGGTHSCWKPSRPQGYYFGWRD
jgi:hypothetical protein